MSDKQAIRVIFVEDEPDVRMGSRRLWSWRASRSMLLRVSRRPARTFEPACRPLCCVTSSCPACRAPNG